MLKKCVTLLFCTLALGASAQSLDPFKIAPANPEPAQVSKQQQIRWIALKEYALTKGIADGRKIQFKNVYDYLEKNKRVLDTIYQVDHLYMQPRKKITSATWNGKQKSSMEDDSFYNGFLIQPPVILISNNLHQISDNGQKKESSSRAYYLAANAQFVSGPIHWQTFLVSLDDLNSNPVPDDPLMRPRDEQEQKMMEDMYKVGFVEGQAQANTEVETRLKTLKTMIIGMNYGRILMDKNVIKEPEVTTAYTPTSGNKTRLTLDTSTATIVNAAEFVLDPSQYKTFIHQPNPLEKR